MLGIVAAADATPRIGDALLIEAFTRERAVPPLGVARAGVEVDNLVACDADLALVRDHDEEREHGDAEADEPLARHWCASAMKHTSRCGAPALTMNVTSRCPGTVS